MTSAFVSVTYVICKRVLLCMFLNDQHLNVTNKQPSQPTQHVHILHTHSWKTFSEKIDMFYSRRDNEDVVELRAQTREDAPGNIQGLS